MRKNYNFGLYDKDEKFLDATNIDANDPAFAMSLFEGFGRDQKGNKYEITETSGHTVELIEVTRD